jgi:Raf kinase inhibitor-like YbhB/YbcL family protein
MVKLQLSSNAFENEGDVPDLYTCRSKNISPPLSFDNAPEGTRSYALIMVDLDTPVGTITHWLVYNIPADFRELSEGIPAGRHLANGLNQGRNGMFRFGYMGPCPPWGRHRYLFRLFALDRMLPSGGALNRRKLLRMMEPHILAEAVLLGYYAKKEQR